MHRPRDSRCHERFDIVPLMLMDRRPLEICIEFA